MAKPKNHKAASTKAVIKSEQPKAQELPKIEGPGVSPTNKFNVLVSEVRAAMVFSSDDEARYVLNSVSFEAKPDKSPILVSTDGRRLCVIQSESIQNSFIQKPIHLIVAAAFLKPLCAFATKHSDTLGIEFHPSHRIIFYVGEDVVIDAEKGAVVEGDYPNWRQVVPSGQKNPKGIDELGLNADYIADFAKAGKLMGCDGVALRMNLYETDGAIEVHIDGKPKFYGVVMPMKTDEPTKQWQPEFLGLQTVNSQAA